MIKSSALILDEQQVVQKIKRIAFEIYENNFSEKELVIAGIDGTGYIFATMLVSFLGQISPFKIILTKVSLNKAEPLKSAVALDQDIQIMNGKCIVITDDVLNTGKTFLQSLKPFLNGDVKKIQTAVLVNRSHKQFPIAADYTGYELSTTINEHVKVSLDEGSMGVYLY
jgi:pyrimidine operon attenuation protein / uracil phosphoribosyltransferase